MLVEPEVRLLTNLDPSFGSTQMCGDLREPQTVLFTIDADFRSVCPALFKYMNNNTLSQLYVSELGFHLLFHVLLAMQQFRWAHIHERLRSGAWPAPTATRWRSAASCQRRRRHQR